MKKLNHTLATFCAAILLASALFAQSQPNLPQYPADQLQMFPTYMTRAAYQQATGHQAPPFNPSLPLKYWEDPKATGTMNYLAFDANAKNAPPTQNFTVPAADLTVNIPGAYAYPAFSEPPTDASISANQVCLKADADAVAKQISPLYPNETYTIQESLNPTFPIRYGADPRRQWYIQFSKGEQAILAETLIEQENANGVGAPGHFAMVSQVEVGGRNPGKTYPPHVTWLADPQVIVPPANHTVIPAPIRPLLSNEQWFWWQSGSPLGRSQWVVKRTDMVAPSNPNPITNDQIQELKNMLQQLLSRPCNGKAAVN